MFIFIALYDFQCAMEFFVFFPILFYTRQPKIGNNEWWLPKSRGSQAWSTAQDSESCPAEVREFKSRPLHYLSINFYILYKLELKPLFVNLITIHFFVSFI
jgi:hypothetical protein